jgi:DNA-binding NarL/FixJ family response regulator
LKVLIVDDSKMVCERISMLVSEVEGMEVAGFAIDGCDAIEQNRRLEPDVVILDIRMPGKNGIEVLKEIKELSRDTVVIVLTNYPDRQHRKSCRRAGADYFFDKSVEFDKIPDVLMHL